MRPLHHVLSATLLALYVVPSPASATTWGDTLTTIMRPLPNLPAFARPGDTLQVWALAPNAPTNWSGSLRFASLIVPLEGAGGGYRSDLARWVLGFRVPAGTPEETFDLVLQSDQTPPDTARHAVRVVASYRTDFTFAQVSDTHLPTHLFSSSGPVSPADTSAIADFGAVIADLNLIHPEFVLHTGDLVNEGELEDYLGMYEMGRAQEALFRFEPPVFVVSGNHDIGGWQATAMPDGTARRNWARVYGWPWLENPPAGDPHHSQDYSFDYGGVHVVGLEGYINNGGYDHYRTDIWGAQSFSAEQMAWLQADLAAVPSGRAKLVYYHYDFGGTLPNGSPGPNFSQVNPVTLGVQGVIWGHNHGVAEGNRNAQPFNLGLQATVDGRRAFRTFRFAGGRILPGPMHKSGGTTAVPTDSLVAAWSGPNDGSRRALAVTIVNRYGETWTSPRLRFVLANHDSTLAVTGGTLAQSFVSQGRLYAYVDATFPAGGTTVVSVTPSQPVAAAPLTLAHQLSLAPPRPNPFRLGASALALRFGAQAEGPVRLSIVDLAGRVVATPFEGRMAAGERTVGWDGRDHAGHAVSAGVYFAVLERGRESHVARVAMLR